jgi:hypothetical protein
VDNDVRWTDEYMRLVGGDDQVPRAAKTRYAHDEIKAAVLRDSKGKCIYCESKPRAVYPGAIEHLVPKAPDKFPEKIVEWANLGFVCFECNRCKSDYWDEDASILDPYVDEPAEHLLFFGPLVLARDQSVRGVVTVHELELDRRTDLIERKAEHIRTVKSYLRSWRAEPEGPLKRVLDEQIRRYAATDKEYTATTWALLDLEGFPR